MLGGVAGDLLLSSVDEPSAATDAVSASHGIFLEPMMGTPLALYVHKDVGDRDIVVDLIQRNGGTVSQSYSGVSYLLVDPHKESGQSLYRQYAGKKNKMILSSQWVHECVRLGTLQTFQTGWANCRVTGNEQVHAPPPPPPQPQPQPAPQPPPQTQAQAQAQTSPSQPQPPLHSTPQRPQLSQPPDGPQSHPPHPPPGPVMANPYSQLPQPMQDVQPTGPSQTLMPPEGPYPAYPGYPPPPPQSMHPHAHPHSRAPPQNWEAPNSIAPEQTQNTPQHAHPHPHSHPHQHQHPPQPQPPPPPQQPHPQMVSMPRGPYRDDGPSAAGPGWTVDGNTVYAPQSGHGHPHPHPQQQHHPGTVVAPHAQGGFEYRTYGRDEQVWAPGQYYDQATYDPAYQPTYMQEDPASGPPPGGPSAPEPTHEDPTTDTPPLTDGTTAESSRGRKRVRSHPVPAPPASTLVLNRRDPTARSPTPPTRVIKSTYGGNLFTADDIEYLKKYIDFCQEQGMVLSLREICERVAVKAPHHTFYSWRRYCNKHQIRLGGYAMTTTTSVDPNDNSQAGPSTQPQPHPNQQQHPHPNHTNLDPNLDPSLHPHPHPHPPHSHPHSMGAGSNIDPISAEFGPHDSHVGASDDGQGLTLSSATGPNTNGASGNGNNNGGGGTAITVSGVGNVVSVGGTSLAGPSGTPLISGLGLSNAGNNSGPGPNAISAAKAKVRAEEAAGLLISQRTRSPTPPRALFRSTTGKGVAFTDEDVVFLIKLLEWRRVQGKSDMVTFWKEIAQKAPHHSRASWMKFYRRHKHELNHTEEDEPLPLPPEKKMRYSRSDDILLARFFLNKPDGTSDKIFQGFARDHPHHPWKGWQEHHRIHKAKVDHLIQKLAAGEVLDETEPQAES
ncbi:uncharacterized protein STEHIDRAFT_172112 [Stereum hirsutum FP-91666 SS1]|uniref:uncharacterized protein n=1 Tax=Stereum hirsutum (strain FP-91666) TaxID=721885 RepID=UPI0004449BB7|nr:uncharacterized protein STEHIDRAFT_172112 [Stereum hirsutum FP-91666 SS1]EIM81077.1 hypothetical protein STEHIDRAFT_172112 [Stereum hirsutum FP-91666 SS1]